MKHGLRTYRLPLLAAASMVLALVLWIAWSWQGYSERTLDWRRQRAQETFDTLNAVIAAMSNGILTDWKQVEGVLASIIRDSRTQFVEVRARHGQLVRAGELMEGLATADMSAVQGERATPSGLVIWGPLRPVTVSSTWTEALNASRPNLGLWPASNLTLVLGVSARAENFASSWFWQRQGPLFGAALVCVLAVTAVWIAGIRRRVLAEELAAERIRGAHLEELALAAAGLAHETKNPLGLIMGMAQRIAADPHVPDHSRAMLEHIMDEVDKATSRLGNFMNFARQRTANLTVAHAKALCAEVAEILGPDFEAGGVDLALSVPDAIILADPDLLRQILVNLLLNSLHASPPDTTVTIRLAPQGRRFTLAVADQGQGIAAELLPDIFKPYITGSPSGHGLGLAIVKRLVEAQGWRIQAASTPGQGATMTITGIKAAREQT